MKKIKFRGKGLETGKIVYGHYWYSENFGAIVNGVIVDPDSVAQLVGYDTNGKEVYEGDILIDEDGFERTAGLDPYPYEWSNGMKVYLKGIEGN